MGSATSPLKFARNIYQCGLALPPGQWLELPVSTESGERTVLTIGNGGEGMVDVICESALLRAHLGTIIGLRLLSSKPSGR